MRRTQLTDLSIFVAVAQAQNFTKAAARLGTSQSALSHAMRRLEAGLGIRLLTRTTRSVAPTEAGLQLLETLVPAFASIDSKLLSLEDMQAKPAGSIRITTTATAAQLCLVPALARFLPNYPGINVEVSVEDGLTDIVAERFDAGVRLGEALAQDMIATRVSGDVRMIVVGAPSYLSGRNVPVSPHDLADHQCINTRLNGSGGLYAWEFERSGQELRVRVEGQTTFNDASLTLQAAVEGLGLAFVLVNQHVAARLADGSLRQVLDDWCPTFPGFYLYYPSRRQPSAAFALLVDALRYREGA